MVRRCLCGPWCGRRRISRRRYFSASSFCSIPINARAGDESLFSDIRAGRLRSAHQSARRGIHLRRFVGILEFLGAREVDLHGADLSAISRSSRCLYSAISGSRLSRSNVSRCTSSCAACCGGGTRRPIGDLTDHVSRTRKSSPSAPVCPTSLPKISTLCVLPSPPGSSNVFSASRC